MAKLKVGRVIGGIVILVLIIGVFMLINRGPSTVTETGPIKIGFIAPLSGDVAIYGSASQGGVVIAAEEINAAGGINGRMIEVIYEDSMCDGKEASTAANKLVNLDNVLAIIGTVCSSATLAIAPIAEENQIVLLSAASSSPAITDAGDYVFRTWPSDSLQGKKMAEYVYDQGIMKVGMIYQNSDYNIGLSSVFRETFEDLGGEIVAAEVYEPTAKDFRTQLTKLKAEDPEALYIVPYTGEAGILLKQVTELGIEVGLYGPETFHAQEVIDSAGESAEGLIYMVPEFDEENPLSKGILDKYEAKYGQPSPFAVITANAYDGMLLVAAALEQEVSSNSIRDYLYTVENYPGTGGTLTIDENGDALKDFQFMIIRDGELQTL